MNNSSRSEMITIKAKAVFTLLLCVVLFNVFAVTTVRGLYHDKSEMIGMFKKDTGFGV